MEFRKKSNGNPINLNRQFFDSPRSIKNRSPNTIPLAEYTRGHDAAKPSKNQEVDRHEDCLK